MDIEIKVIKSNGQAQSAISDIPHFSDAYLLMDTVVDIRESSYDCEFVIYIQPRRDIALKKVELSFRFDPKGAFVYNSGTTGASRAGIVPADTSIPFSRDVFFASNSGGVNEERFFFLNLGFTSFERFFTYFTYEPGCVTAVYDLENRPIVEGTIMRLESIMIDDSVCAGLFLESVSETIALRQKLRAEKPGVILRSMSGLWDETGESGDKPESLSVPLGQYNYSGTDISNREYKTIALVDGNWQSEGSYSCVYDVNRMLLPEGFDPVSKKGDSTGTITGLNFAPAMISSDSVHFKEYNYRLYDDRNFTPSFSNVYPLNLSSQDVMSETAGFIRNAVKQWGIGMFRFDHLDALLFRSTDNVSLVVYQRDYSVALFRSFFKKLRNAAGDNVFISALGPFGECAGIFDGIVVSALCPESDAVCYGVADNYRLMRDSVLNLMYRAYYNSRLYITFSEGIMTDSQIVDDDGNVLSRKLSDEEIQLLVIAAAFSGGALSICSDPAKFSPKCRNVLSGSLPPAGIAAKPLDFWEYPYCTHTVAKVPDKSVRSEVHVLYNFENYEEKRTIKNTEPSIFVNMLTGEIAASGRAFAEFTLHPHSALPVLVKQMPEFPALLWTDENIYRGCMNTSDMYFSDTLIITSDAPKGTRFHIYVPYGRSGDVYVNDKKLKLNTLEFKELGEGAVFAYIL